MGSRHSLGGGIEHDWAQGGNRGMDPGNKGLPYTTRDKTLIPHCYSIAQTLLQPPGLLQALFSPGPRQCQDQRSLCGVGDDTDPSPPEYRGFGVSRSAM